MTKELIQHLKPGLGLDSLIAEHVMGLKWIYDDDEQPEVVPYSTDIKAAWEVINKIAEFAKWKIESIEENKTICVNLLQCEGVLRFQAYAETAPLAICRAALLWKLFDEKQST